MRLLTLLILIILVSCSTAPQVRLPASDTLERLGMVDVDRSLVQIFQALGSHEVAYYFYVQLKDTKGNFVDATKSDFKILTTRGKRVKFDFERLLVGRYYLSIPKKSHQQSHQMDLYVRGKVLRGQLKISMRQPHPKHTTLKLLSNHGNQLTLELRFADQKNHPVEVPQTPEILLEGGGAIENLLRVKEGIWQFTVYYPEENQILYLGVRTMGLTFQNLYRYQHVEK
jgi:hypothetical protein